MELIKTKVTYNRPLIVGFTILELSKTLMYDFHYNTIQKQYGNKAKLCFTDTDSLCYHIEADDFYQDMLQNQSAYDFSGYPKDHFCFSNDNKKVIGKFKDEMNSTPIQEFVGLRAKMYSVLLDDDTDKKTGKGVPSRNIKQLRHQNYKSCIFSQSKDELQQYTEFNTIQSTNHQIYTLHQKKVSLCAYDDKRHVLDDNINTLAHGHYKIANWRGKGSLF